MSRRSIRHGSLCALLVAATAVGCTASETLNLKDGSMTMTVPDAGGGGGSGGTPVVTGSGGSTTGGGGSGGGGSGGGGGGSGGSGGTPTGAGGSGGGRIDGGAGETRSDGGGDLGGAMLSYATDIAPLLSVCMGCHGGSSGLTISYTGVMDAVNSTHTSCTGLDASKKRVVPGNPDGSLLYIKISMATPPTNCGAHMPKAPTTNLTTQQVATIRTWIMQGAKP